MHSIDIILWLQFDNLKNTKATTLQLFNLRICWNILYAARRPQISIEGQKENTITRSTGDNKIREHLRCEKVLGDDLNNDCSKCSR